MRCGLLSTGAKRSPAFWNRRTAFLMWNWAGDSPFFTSSQASGADTGAPSWARSTYGAAMVLLFPICR